MLGRIGDEKIFLSKRKDSFDGVYTYSEAGRFYISNNLSQGAKMDLVGEFLCASIDEIIKESYNVIRKTKRSPYTYIEDEFHTILAPAFAKATNGFVMKSPAKVNWGSLNQDGVKVANEDWVDYRCRYKGYNYCIKVNKKSVSYNTGELSDKAKEEWKKSCIDLKKIRDKVRADEAENTVGITLEILNVYVSGEEEKALKYTPEELCELRRSAIAQISNEYDVQWSCLWALDKDIVQSQEYIHGFEAYPAVMFLVRAD